jgi:hypothetical protein
MSLADHAQRRRTAAIDARRRPRRGGSPEAAVAADRPRSLEDLLLRIDRELERGARPSCPVCAAHALNSGSCGACGSELS